MFMVKAKPERLCALPQHRCEGGISGCATQNWVHDFDHYLDDEQEYCSLNIFKARSEKLDLMGLGGTYQVCTFYFHEAGKWNVA